MPKRGCDIAYDQGTTSFIHAMPTVGVVSLSWWKTAFEANEGGKRDDG